MLRTQFSLKQSILSFTWTVTPTCWFERATNWASFFSTVRLTFGMLQFISLLLLWPLSSQLSHILINGPKQHIFNYLNEDLLTNCNFYRARYSLVMVKVLLNTNQLIVACLLLRTKQMISVMVHNHPLRFIFRHCTRLYFRVSSGLDMFLQRVTMWKRIIMGHLANSIINCNGKERAVISK